MLNFVTKLAKNQKIYEDFIIQRKAWKGSKTGERYYSYLLKAELKSDEVTVNFRCPKNDPVGYKNLARVFQDADKVYLLVTTDTTYNGVKTQTYSAISFDENGLASRGNILPAATSDKDLLADLLDRADYFDRLRRQAEAAEFEEEQANQAPTFEPEDEPDEELIPVEEPESKGKKGKKAE